MTLPTLEQLAQQHQAEILAYLARLLGDIHDAEDISQETWLRAHAALPRLAPDANRRAWLYRIATNTAFNLLKRRRRERRDQDGQWPPAPGPEARDQWRSVVQAVETLPPKQRAALMQRQFQGLSYREIAAALDCTEAAARANVYQAIQRLRRLLVDE